MRLSESGKISHIHRSIMPRVHRTRIDKADVGQRCPLHYQPESCNHMFHMKALVICVVIHDSNSPNELGFKPLTGLSRLIVKILFAHLAWMKLDFLVYHLSVVFQTSVYYWKENKDKNVAGEYSCEIFPLHMTFFVTHCFVGAIGWLKTSDRSIIA